MKVPTEALKLLAALGLVKTHEEPVSSQGVMTHFVDLPGKAPVLEFLEPLESAGPDAVIAKYVREKGVGVHHLAFEVVDPKGLAALCEELRGLGYRLIYEKPQPGAHGMIVNFIHPKSAGGLLIELLEKAPKTA